MIPIIWGLAEIPTVRAPFLKILSCRIFFKKIVGHLLLLFFSSKNCQKAKVNILAGNGRNYQILLETCFLRHHLINILP